MEIPTKIRFDVLLVLLGVAFIIAPFQFTFLNNTFLQFSSLILGAPLFLIGINFIKYEYDMETELARLDYVQRKLRYMEYFKKEDLLLENTLERNRKQMMQIVN
ncbi:MAG: hypothetical protein AABX98_02790 [Nanoarchaeota archaeon]